VIRIKYDDQAALKGRKFVAQKILSGG